MQPVNLFDLAAQQARWLGVRQSAVAGNIANVNTPGYQAMDVEPFAAMLDDRHVTLSATEPGHLAGSTPIADAISLRPESDDPAVMPSGNTVSLEGELMKSADIERSFNLNTAIVKAFQAMYTMTTKA
jgi:flagellar basal-body rod protein FlgB